MINIQENYEKTYDILKTETIIKNKKGAKKEPKVSRRY